MIVIVINFLSFSFKVLASKSIHLSDGRHLDGWIGSMVCFKLLMGFEWLEMWKSIFYLNAGDFNSRIFVISIKRKSPTTLDESGA